MKRLALLLLFSSLVDAQDLLVRGADIYNKTCATGYCHAPKGASGSSAPRLAARGFSEEYISQTVRHGIPGTAMPAFGTVLSRGEAAQVVAYVASLNGIAPSQNSAPEAQPEKKLPPEAALGRDLFFDSVLGFGRCATCHQVDGFGIPIASPIAKVPIDVAALRQLATPQIRTATSDGESFPALVVSQGSKRIKLYDLTSPPPVLKTFDPAAVTVREGSQWRHASTLTAYTDVQLQAILMYLRSVIHS